MNCKVAEISDGTASESEICFTKCGKSQAYFEPEGKYIWNKERNRSRKKNGMQLWCIPFGYFRIEPALFLLLQW